MTIEQLQKGYHSYIAVGEDIYKGLLLLRDFSNVGLQGWMGCNKEEQMTEFHFTQLVTSYINMIEKLSEPIEIDTIPESA